MAAKTKRLLMKESRQRKLDAGLVRKEYWATPETHSLIKARLKELHDLPTS